MFLTETAGATPSVLRSTKACCFAIGTPVPEESCVSQALSFGARMLFPGSPKIFVSVTGAVIVEEAADRDAETGETSLRHQEEGLGDLRVRSAGWRRS